MNSCESVRFHNSDSIWLTDNEFIYIFLLNFVINSQDDDMTYCQQVWGIMLSVNEYYHHNSQSRLLFLSIIILFASFIFRPIEEMALEISNNSKLRKSATIWFWMIFGLWTTRIARYYMTLFRCSCSFQNSLEKQVFNWLNHCWIRSGWYWTKL